jgi:hypothetical protein
VVDGTRYPHPHRIFDQIVFARSELISGEKGEDVLGDFVCGMDGRCCAMPVTTSEAAPHPEKRDGWLVLFVAPENSAGAAVWRPVGWYEEACFAGCYQRRPEPALRQDLYIVSTQAKNAYVIPKETQSSFPVIANDHFTRRWTYARSAAHSGKWRERLAKLAEEIVSRKAECTRIG